MVSIFRVTVTVRNWVSELLTRFDSSKTLALYKLYTYLLTYLLNV